VAIALALAILTQQVLANMVSGGGSVAITILAEQGLLDPGVLAVANLAVSIFGLIISFLVSAFFSGGIVGTGLKAARGQPVTIGDAFSGGKYFGPMFVALIGFVIAWFIGSILCVVPGVILSLGLSLYGAIIVDQGLSGLDALKKSWEMTKGHKMTIFVMGILGFFVFVAGLLACGIGAVLVSAPMTVVAFAWLYLKIKGEPVVEPT
jgi:uncharacterized membrane protein